MKKIWLVGLFLVLSDVVWTQDLRTDKTMIISAKFSTILADNNNGPFWLHTEDAMLKFGHQSLRWYCFVSDISGVKIIQPSTKPGDTANIEVDNNHNGGPAIDGELKTHLARIGVGISFGTDSLRFYCGPGYWLNGQIRGHCGFYWKTKFFRQSLIVSALTDIASADWCYDIKAMIYGQLTPSLAMGIGVYAKTLLGFGLMGQIEPTPWLTCYFGEGYDPEAKVKDKFKMWTGITLAF